MKASGGNRVEVFLNDLTKAPLEQQLIPGRRHRYLFSGILDDIGLFRVDPTDGANIDILIYSIEVRDRKGLIHRYDPRVLSRWTRYSERTLEPIDGALHLVSTTDDPIMLTTEKLSLRRTIPPALAKCFAAVVEPDMANDFMVPGILLVLLSSSLMDSKRVWHLPFVVAVVVTSFVVMSAVLRSVHTLDPVSVAVGRASFMGISTRASELATVSAALAACVLALSAHVLILHLQHHRSKGGKIGRPAELSNEANRSVPQPGVYILMIAFTALALAPHIYVAVHYMLATPPIGAGWDSNNLTYWSYLVSKGYLPYRDFWYPYAGRYTFWLSLPWGPLMLWSYQSILYFALFSSVYKLSGYRFWDSFIATTVAIIGELTGRFFMSGDRYLVSIVLVLSYLALERSYRRVTPTLALFWLLWGVGCFFGPAESFYAFSGIAVIILIDTLQHKLGSWVLWLRRLAWEFTIPLTITGLMLMYFAIRGQLCEMAELYLRASDSAAYSAIPADILWLKHFGLRSVLSHLFQYSTVALVAPPIFIGLGLCERLRRARNSSRYGDILLAVGVLLLIVLQKHLVRPMETTLLIYLALGLFAYFSFWPERRTVVESIIGGLFAGIVIHALYASGGVGEIVSRIEEAPGQVFKDIRTIIFDRSLLEKSNALAYSSRRFAEFTDEQSVVAKLRSLSPMAGDPSVFVLSDDPVIYILTGQLRPVFHANMYNASPLYEQEKVVNWLAKDRPSFVLFDPNALDFDGFPKVVRVPLVFNAVIQNYVPADTSGRFQILRQRRANEGIAMSFWREKLGAVTDFGHLASESSFDQFEPCRSSGDSCADFIEVRLARPSVKEETVVIPFEIAGEVYRIAFDSTRGRNKYYLLLDRFWPWAAAKQEGVTRRIVEGQLSGEIKAHIIPRKAKAPILY